jgi:hypothetical protein
MPSLVRADGEITEATVTLAPIPGAARTYPVVQDSPSTSSPPPGGPQSRAMRMTTPPITSPSSKSLRGLSGWALWQSTHAGDTA